MADTSSRAPWEALSQQYWKAWADQATQAGGAPGGKVPWHEGLELWSRMFAPPSGSGQGEVVERMLSGARQFAQFAQAAQAQAAGGAPAMNPKAWTEAFSAGFGGLSATQNPMLEALRSITGEGAMGFEQLAAETQRMAGPIRQEMSAMFSLPAFGSTREQQERTQALAAAGVACAEWMGRYNALMLKASQRAVELMETKLAERSEPGREISTLRAMYDLWIDAAEEGYAEVAMSQDFRHVYGELVNAQMRMRKLVNAEVERNTQTLGIPTRTELNSVHARLADVRRQLAKLEEAVAGATSETEAAAPKQATIAKRAAAPARAKPAKRKPAAEAAPRSEFAKRLAASRKSSRNGSKAGS